MDQRTRKLRTIHKALHARDDIDRLYVAAIVMAEIFKELREQGIQKSRLYVSRKERGRGRGLASVEDSIKASIWRLDDYKKRANKV